MNIFLQHYEYLKNEASLLLKHARGTGPQRDEAVARFRALQSFTSLTSDDTPALDRLQLKHAMSVIAMENGYESWAELKSALEQAAETSPLAEVKDQFYPVRGAAYWNNWFASYKKAKQVHAQSGGFLLPFRNQFFICEEGFVDNLGLPASLPEWRQIGFDWVHPAHVKAWLQLNEQYATVLSKARNTNIETRNNSESQSPKRI